MVVALLLVGCGDESPKEMKHTDFHLVVQQEDVVMVEGVKVGASSLSSADGTTCWVTLTRGEYPRCLQHEVRHCIEGNFHEGYSSYEDCFD